jgi:hypothetical protein
MIHQLFGKPRHPRKRTGATPARRKLGEMDRRSLIDILDKEFSSFVRMTAIIKCKGVVPCCTCGTYMIRMDKMDCGHFITRGELSTRFDPGNVAPQCRKCNSFQGGMAHRFRSFLIKRDGLESVEAIEAKACKPCFISDPEFVEMIKDYRAKNKQLKKKIGEVW